MINITSYYGNSASEENNAKVVSIGDLKVYYSYETVVAVKIKGKLTVVENNWGPTTGKHLNAIDGGTLDAKAARLSKEEFNNFIKKIEVQVVDKE